jgi:hypothetical protein
MRMKRRTEDCSGVGYEPACRLKPVKSSSMTEPVQKNLFVGLVLLSLCMVQAQF